MIINNKEWREYRHANDEKVVATNGCFDIIHSGHVDYLDWASLNGDVLVVGINGDESVRTLKGNGRPINSVEDRAKVVDAFWFVDYVYIFNETKAVNFLRTIEPDVYVKAGDYSIETLDKEEKGVLDSIKADIYFAPFIEGKSTTKILETLNNEKK